MPNGDGNGRCTARDKLHFRQIQIWKNSTRLNDGQLLRRMKNERIGKTMPIT